MPCINSQGRQDRVDLTLKIGSHRCTLLRIQLLIIKDIDMLCGKQWQKLIPPALPRLLHQWVQASTHCSKLLFWSEAIGTSGGDVSHYLVLQPCQANHDELIEIGIEDRQKLYALQQRMTAILRLFKDAPVEFDPTQFTIDVKVGSM